MQEEIYIPEFSIRLFYAGTDCQRKTVRKMKRLFKTFLRVENGNWIKKEENFNSVCPAGTEKDFSIWLSEKDILVSSKSRKIIIIYEDYVRFHYEDEAKMSKMWNDFSSILLTADIAFASGNRDASVRFMDCVAGAYRSFTDEQDTADYVSLKQDAKKSAKMSMSKYRYRVGEKYSLRQKGPDGAVLNEMTFQVRKFVYTVGVNPVNIVIMKQLSGKPCSRRCISHLDASLFHLKYEPGLFIFPMNTNFFKISDVQLERKD